MTVAETLVLVWLVATHGEAGSQWSAVPVTEPPARPVWLYEFIVPAGATTLEGIDFQRVA